MKISMLSTVPAFDVCGPIAAPPLTTAVLRDLEQMERLQQEWQGLFERCATPCIFLSPAWHVAWWRAFKGASEAHIVTVRDASQRLVGIAPLQLRRDVWRGLRVRVLGSYNNDHASRTNFLIDPAHTQAVTHAIAQQLVQSQWHWDVLHLQQLPQQAAWVTSFTQACQAAGLTPFAPTPGVAKCTITLHGTWQDFLANRSSHFRSRLKENMRRVQKHGRVEYRRSGGTAEDFAVFEKLEQTSWKAQDSYARLGPKGWAFQQEVALAADAGVRCHNIFLEVDGKVVGAIHAVGIGGVMYSLQMLFDESVRHLYPGRALFAVHIGDMFADAQTSVLDLNGNSPFCQSWTEQAAQFVDLQVFNRNPYSRLLALLKRFWGRNR